MAIKSFEKKVKVLTQIGLHDFDNIDEFELLLADDDFGHIEIYKFEIFFLFGKV